MPVPSSLPSSPPDKADVICVTRRQRYQSWLGTHVWPLGPTSPRLEVPVADIRLPLPVVPALQSRGCGARVGLSCPSPLLLVFKACTLKAGSRRHSERTDAEPSWRRGLLGCTGREEVGEPPARWQAGWEAEEPRGAQGLGSWHQGCMRNHADKHLRTPAAASRWTVDSGQCSCHGSATSRLQSNEGSQGHFHPPQGGGRHGAVQCGMEDGKQCPDRARAAGHGPCHQNLDTISESRIQLHLVSVIWMMDFYKHLCRELSNFAHMSNCLWQFCLVF